MTLSPATTVALRKESVDRNTKSEMKAIQTEFVALRKESVDRNHVCLVGHSVEMQVALRKESVDRNAFLRMAAALRASRSPQGERG